MSISKSINYFYEYYLNPRFGSKKYILPTHVNFPITDNCNSECRMCNVWKDKSENELSPDEIKTIFSSKLFVNTKHLGISGGEPTLRKDLLLCITSILDALPKLKSLSITTHGFHPTKWERLLPDIIKLCKKRNTFFKLNISVDGIGDLHEEVRRVTGGWKKVVKTLDIAKRNKVSIQIQCTVSKHNIFGINEVLHFAKANNFEYVFRKATSINRLYNDKITKEFFTSNQEDSFFADFIESKSVNTTTDNPGRRLFYRDLAKRLKTGAKRNTPCHFQYNGVLISSHGEMFHCSIDEKPLGNCRNSDAYDIYFSDNSIKQLNNLLNNICPNCIHDQTGTWNPFAVIKEVMQTKFKFFDTLFNYISFGVKNILALLGLYSRKVTVNLKNEATIHIIGAYGGEHVGDSAILGGVILRILERNVSVDKIVVYSKRPDRTLFWVDGLDFNYNVKIEVSDYTSLNQIELSKRDKLIWAGGPIMEMPIDLFDHYTTIKSFVKKGIPFEIIGCGWGPFKTKYSLAKASKILNSASYIEMRDKYNLPIDYVLKHDPAFDYLYQENITIENKWTWSKNKIDEFFKKIKTDKSTKLVLLNLRPVWNKYNKSNKSSNELDDGIIETLFEVIRKLPKQYKVISIPFNTDHYGFSDMDPALLLKDKCIKENLKNYYVFDRELNARDMIYLLKNFDSGICMRFHACIFLTSQKIPVYGIDYTAGEIGKVGGLFKSFKNENWSNILNLDSEKIISFLNNNK